MIETLDGPFDLTLSLQAAASFYPGDEPGGRTLRAAIRSSAGPAAITIEQVNRTPPRLAVSAARAVEAAALRRVARRLVAADLDLRPFYRLTQKHPVLGPIAASLPGLKPLQPASLFEAAVIAITEQQLSMAAAYRIRSRIVRRFGEPVEDLLLFPTPQTIAEAPDQVLADCGLSRQKLRYLKTLALRIASHDLDLEAMRELADDEIRACLIENPGLGRWSVEHILLRGFARPSGLPSGDVSLQKVVGFYLGQGLPLSAAELERALCPLRPFHGLAAFYLSVAYRRRAQLDPRRA